MAVVVNYVVRDEHILCYVQEYAPPCVVKHVVLNSDSGSWDPTTGRSSATASGMPGLCRATFVQSV